LVRFRQPEQAKLDSLLRGPDNVEWLNTFIFWHLRDRLLQTVVFDDPKPVAEAVVVSLCQEVSDAVIARLRRKYPAGASRRPEALVRSYPGPLAKLLDLQLSLLTDSWCSDLEEHPTDTLAARFLRLAPHIRSIESRRGKARCG